MDLGKIEILNDVHTYESNLNIYWKVFQFQRLLKFAPHAPAVEHDRVHVTGLLRHHAQPVHVLVKITFNVQDLDLWIPESSHVYLIQLLNNDYKD